MPLYECKACNYKSYIKTHYNNHLNTKKHQRNIETNGCIIAKMSTNEHKMSTNEHKMSTNEHNLFVCEKCNKTFKTKPIMRRHMLHYCKYNVIDNSVVKQLKQENKELKKNHQKEKKKLCKEIEKLLENRGNIINNNITNNIILNNYGKEDLSHITGDMLTNLLRGPMTMISELTKMIHFNEEKPQNMNIFIPNKRDKYIKVYSNNEWKLEDKKERIPDIVDKSYYLLDTHYEKNDDKLNSYTKSTYKQIQNAIDNKDKEIHEKNCQLVELEILNGSRKHKDKF